MGLHNSSQMLDLEALCSQLKAWLENRMFGTKVERTGGSIVLRGNWPLTSIVEAFSADKYGAGLMVVDSALHVAMRHEGGQTQVIVKQGSWDENVVGNLLWTINTGGANVLLSQFGKKLVRDLEAYVDELLAADPSASSDRNVKPLAINQMPPPTRRGPAFTDTRTTLCPNCSAPFKVTREQLDSRVICGSCQEAFVIRQRSTRR